MTISLDDLNNLPVAILKMELLRCCASHAWADAMVKAIPYLSAEDLYQKAEKIWLAQSEPAWLQAFDGHAKIGDVRSLKKKYADTGNWSKQEQAGVSQVSDAVIEELADYNRRYEEKFGFIFIVFATGKSAAQMLAILKERYPNTRDTELKNAATEQNKITQLRLKKLLTV